MMRGRTLVALAAGAVLLALPGTAQAQLDLKPCGSIQCGRVTVPLDRSGATAGSVSLYVDGAKAGEGRVDGTEPMIFSADETTDVGTDGGTPVSDDYGPKDSRFTGRIRWVQLDIDEAAEDLDHLITPEERLRIALARQ